MNMIPLTMALVLMLHAGACSSGDGTPDTPAAAPVQAAQTSQPPAQTPIPSGEAPARPGERGPAVARVNGTPIYKVDYDAALATFMQSNQMGPEAPDEKKQEAQKVVLDGLIGSELLFQKAKSVPVEVPQAEVDEAIKQTKSGMGEEGFAKELTRRGMTEADLVGLVRQNLMIQKFIKEQVLNAVTVSDTETKTFYDEHQAEMQKPEDVEASHILVRFSPTEPAEKKTAARKKIDEALTRIKAGEDFAAMAKTYSEDNSASAGGTLGAITRGQTVPAFDEAVFKLGVGQVSEVVETQFGFHIIKVTGKHPAGVAQLAEVKDRIGDFLKQQKSRDAVEKLVGSLRAAAKVEVL